MTRIISAAIISLVFFSSCHYLHRDRITGNGKVISQARNFSGFTGLDVSSAINLYVKQDSSFSVKVEADENLQEYIIIEQNGNTLKIKQKDNSSLDATGKIKVYVNAPSFKKIEASGACHISGENLLTAADEINISVTGASGAELELNSPKVSAEMTGASHLRLRGQIKDLSIIGSGASHAYCFGLLSENVKVDVEGASRAEVFASVKLDVEASGASHVHYKGNATVNKHTSGAGDVSKEE